ncbi:MAG TPA: amidohydrolase family protein [Chitinophagaceae bacterium]
MDMLIIDSHCHAGKGDGFTGPWDTFAPLDTFIARSRKAGINKTVLFAAFHTNYAKANEDVARIVNKHPEQFMGYVFLHAERDKGNIYNMVKRGVEEFGFCGIKCHRYDARITREICDVAQHFSLPVLYDVLGEVSSVELLATAYPAVNFIVPHLGSFADDWKVQLSCIDFLARHKNIFTDTSGIKRFDLLEMAYKRAGAQKILFGTDGPWLHPKLELAKIWELNPTEEEAALMLHKNFLRLTATARNRIAEKKAA